MKPFAPSFQPSHTFDNTSSSLRSIPNWVWWNEVKAGHFSLRWKQSSCRRTRTGRSEGTKPPSLLCAYRHTPTFSTEAFPKAKWTSSLIKGTSRLPQRPKPRLPFPQSLMFFFLANISCFFPTSSNTVNFQKPVASLHAFPANTGIPITLHKNIYIKWHVSADKNTIFH